MADPNELLADPDGEIVRTQGKLRAYLSSEIVAQLDEYACHQAAAFVAGLVGGLDVAISSVRKEAVAHERYPQATQEVQMARMRAAVAAADPRRLAGVLFEAPQGALLGPYRGLVASLCAHDFRIDELKAQLTLPREADAWIPHAVLLPLAPVAGALANHAARMKKAMERLRPGVLDFGLGMAASIGAGMLVHALGGSVWAARKARRTARAAVRGHTGATRFTGFLETTVASLVEVRAVLVEAAPMVQQRAHVTLFALYGGAITCATVFLSQSRAELASVDFEQGRLGLRLQNDTVVELTRFVEATVEQVDSAIYGGDWARATTLAEEALAVFVRYPERCAVRLDGKPAVVVLNEIRAQVLWRASALARRSGPAAVARILLDLVGRAPFLWEGTKDVPRAGDVARDLLALEVVIEAGQPRDAARSALIVLAQRTETARALGMEVKLSLGADDVALIRLLSSSTRYPVPAPAASFRQPGVLAILAVARDLSRRADAARVAIGPTALGFRRRGRRRLTGWIVAGVAVGVISTVALGSWGAWSGSAASEATASTRVSAPVAIIRSPMNAAAAMQSSTPVAGPPTATAHPAAHATPSVVVSGSLLPKGTAPASTPQGSRSSCLRACVTSCNDDSNCERACAGKCPH